MTQLPLEQRIRNAAAQHARLLQTLAETDYAPSAYQQSTSYISTLKKDIINEEKKLANLGHVRFREYQDHKKYRDSHVKRWTSRLAGKTAKFEEEASKEEQEWLDALQKELSAKTRLEQLKLDLVQADKTHAELANVATVRNQTQLEIDELYNQLFQGPTPDIPAEDEKEREVKAAEGEFNVVQLLLSTEKQATAILRDADKFLKRALADIADARSASSMDLWGVGGSMAELAERSALGRCQTHTDQVEMLISQAQRVQPAIGHVGGWEIAQQNFMTDVFFDNIFTDLDMREKVKKSQAQLQSAQQVLTKELGKAAEREGNIQNDWNQAKAQVAAKRQQLQELRVTVFESILADGQTYAPPTYEERPPTYSASET